VAIDPNLLKNLPLILLVLAMLVGIPMAYRLWRETQEEEDDEEPVTDEDLLLEFKQAYEDGEMDAAEYQRVRELIERRKTSGAAQAKIEPPSSPEPSGPPPLTDNV